MGGEINDTTVWSLNNCYVFLLILAMYHVGIALGWLAQDSPMMIRQHSPVPFYLSQQSYSGISNHRPRTR